LARQKFLSNYQNGQKGEILAIGGGKGTIGKTFLTANLGIHLSKMGKRVILMDANITRGNLHSCLGISAPSLTLSDLIQGRANSIHDIVSPTKIPNLSLISGAKDIIEIANPLSIQKLRLIRMMNQLDFDYFLMDLGGETSFNHLDLFLIADHCIFVVLPEPSSIDHLYRLIKGIFYRKFKQLAKNKRMREIILAAMNLKNEKGLKTPHDLLNEIVLIDGEMGQKFQKEINIFKPQVIVNQVCHPDDMALGFSFRGCCSQYFGINVEYLGYIDYDPSLKKSSQKNQPIAIKIPYSSPSRCIEKISHNFLKQTQLTLNDYYSPQAMYQ